jgi:hypothetical protein
MQPYSSSKELAGGPDRAASRQLSAVHCVHSGRPTWMLLMATPGTAVPPAHAGQQQCPWQPQQVKDMYQTGMTYTEAAAAAAVVDIVAAATVQGPTCGGMWQAALDSWPRPAGTTPHPTSSHGPPLTTSAAPLPLPPPPSYNTTMKLVFPSLPYFVLLLLLMIWDPLLTTSAASLPPCPPPPSPGTTPP